MPEYMLLFQAHAFICVNIVVQDGFPRTSNIRRLWSLMTGRNLYCLFLGYV